MRQVILNSIKMGLVLSSISLVGCIVDQGSEKAPSNLPPPDFSVPATGTGDPGDQSPDAPSDEDDPPVSTQNQKIEVVSPNPTRDFFVDLKVTAVGWPWMKIGFSTTCQDGDWQIFTPNARIQLPTSQSNKEVMLSVMFSDLDSNDSVCYVTSVFHDSIGPEIILKRYPAPSVEEGQAPEIEYQITDVSGVASAGCSLNGINKNCPSGGPHVIKMTELPEGTYDFAIQATDALGNTSSTHVPWNVVSTYRRLTQSYEIKDQRKVDILMIIDNSGSMAYEQQNMAKRTGNLLSVIRGLDWQIGVTTTDPSNKTFGDGRLVPFVVPGGLSSNYVLSSAMPEADAQWSLAQTLQRTETGSGSEQGIYVTYRALERSFEPESLNRKLIRPNAQFAAVVISDEDESANGAKNDPHNLIKYIADSFGGKKNFSFHSIIHKPGDKNCVQGAGFGNRYKTLSDLTGGVIGSVCEQDYAQQVAGIANGIRDLLKTLTLECQPVVARGITITKDGAPYSQSYSVEGVNLKFATELTSGNFAVSYSCLK